VVVNHDEDFDTLSTFNFMNMTFVYGN